MNRGNLSGNGQNYHAQFNGRGRGFRRGFRNRFSNYRRPPRSNVEPQNYLLVQANVSQLSQPEATDIGLSKASGPYSGWKLYIQDQAYEPNSPFVAKLGIAEEYYKANDMVVDVERKSFPLDFKKFSTDQMVLSKWPEIANEIRENPEKSLNILGLAMHQALASQLMNERSQLTGESTHTIRDAVVLPKIIARLVNFSPLLPLRKMKSNSYGKFVCVKGTVVKVSSIKPLCINMAFQCISCGKEFTLSQPYGQYTLPTKCIVKGCRGQAFHPRFGSEKTKTVDWQSVRLQEISVDQCEAGLVPRSVEVELMYDLVDSCVPGDLVALCGIVKVTSSDAKEKTKPSKDKCTFLLYILGNSVTNLKGTNMYLEGRMASFNLELSEGDSELIQEIANCEDLFKVLVASLCPCIYGHELVKAGLILTLFGGAQKYLDKNNQLPIRGDPHILVVGDPGLGKSQMLQACNNISPRGVYVCGNTTTTAGLTVTLSRDGGIGDYTLEAGAIALSDQGNCCIDEFDKMSAQHNALLEVMEQQIISIAKAGMVCSFPARTSIIAAANPVGGHYDKSKTVSENLRIGSPLLSRFDLVFILLDKPNMELDCKLSEHVISMHSNSKRNCNNRLKLDELNVSVISTPSTSTQAPREDLKEEPLLNRLRYNNGEECDLIPHELFRRYVAHARKNVQPVITPGAAKILQNFYLELRNRLKSCDGTPVTTRQLESLIRLTEARAKLELRNECVEQDALDVVDIMKHSMVDVWSDEFGLLNVERSEHGTGSSARSSSKRFINILNKTSERTCNSLFSVDQMKQLLNENGIKVNSFIDFLDSLNIQGYLIKKGPKIYKLLTTDY